MGKQHLWCEREAFTFSVQLHNTVWIKTVVSCRHGRVLCRDKSSLQSPAALLSFMSQGSNDLPSWFVGPGMLTALLRIPSLGTALPSIPHEEETTGEARTKQQQVWNCHRCCSAPGRTYEQKSEASEGHILFLLPSRHLFPLWHLRDEHLRTTAVPNTQGQTGAG